MILDSVTCDVVHCQHSVCARGESRLSVILDLAQDVISIRKGNCGGRGDEVRRGRWVNGEMEGEKRRGEEWSGER